MKARIRILDLVLILVGLVLVLVPFLGGIDNIHFQWFFCVIGGVILIAALGSVLFKIIRNKQREEQEKFILTNGQESDAILINVRQTGIYVHKIPEYLFEFKINQQGKSGYIVNKKVCLPFIELAKVKVGMPIKVLIHPEHPNKFIVFWEDAGIRTS